MSQTTINLNWLSVIVISLFLFFLFLYPLSQIFFYTFGFGDGGEISDIKTQIFLREDFIFWDVFDEYYLLRIVKTIFQASLGALICVIIGLAVAWAIWVLPDNIKSPSTILQITVNRIPQILLIPFLVPAIVVVIAIQALGINLNNFPLPTLIYAYIFYNLGVAVWLIMVSLKRIPLSTLNSARCLGANNRQLFFQIVLPNIKNTLLAVWALIFLWCASSFSLAFMLGGQEWATLEVEIYLLTTQSLNLQLAGALAILQLLIMIGVSGVFVRFDEVMPLSLNIPSKGGVRWHLSPIIKNILLIFCFFITIIIIAPLFALLYQALQTFTTLQFLFYDGEFYKAIANTLKFSLYATPLTVVLSFASAYWSYHQKSQNNIVRLFKGLIFYMPYLVSATILALALLISYPKVSNSSLILILAYTLIAYPPLARTIYNGLLQHNPNLFLAAQNLGANKLQAFYHGTLPQIMPQIRSGLAIAVATMLGEFSATLFLTRPENATLSTYIYEHLGRIGSRNVEIANWACVILLLIALTVFALINGQGIMRKTYK